MAKEALTSFLGEAHRSRFALMLNISPHLMKSGTAIRVTGSERSQQTKEGNGDVKAIHDSCAVFWTYA